MSQKNSVGLRAGLPVLSLSLGVLALTLIAGGQVSPTSTSPLAPPANGPRRVDTGAVSTAIVNATLHIAPGKVSPGATLRFNSAGIVGVDEGAAGGAAGGAAPALRQPLANHLDYTGMHVYAGFIESLLEIDVPRPDANSSGAHWNARITPQRSVLDRGSSGVDAATSESLRSMGFVAANLAPKGGILRGSTALVALAPNTPDSADVPPRVYAERVFQYAGFDLSRTEMPDVSRWPQYPDSQMGAIALVRQTLSDAAWQEAQRAKGTLKDATNALDALKNKPALLFDTQDELDALRASAIAKEFNTPLTLVGSGTEFKRLGALKEANRAVVLPLNYPARPKLGSLGEIDDVNLRDLMAWEQGPTNPRRLDALGLTVALTTSKVPDKLGGRGSFKDKLALAIKHGLTSERALAMLTTNPAQIMGLSDRFGTLEAGKVASFVVADGPLFTDRPDAPGKDEPGYVRPGKIVEVWIDGVRYPVAKRDRRDLVGVWEVALANPAPNLRFTLTIDEQNTATLKRIVKDAAGKETIVESKSTSSQFDDQSVGGRFRFTFELTPFGGTGIANASGLVERGPNGELTLQGESVDSDATRYAWSATRGPQPAPEPKKPNFNATWTLVLPIGPAKASDASQPRLVIADKKVQVKKGTADLATETVSFADDAIVYNVKGLDAAKPDGLVVRLTPVKDQPDRLSASMGPDAGQPEAFQLARWREMPETDDIASIPEKLGLPFGAYAMLEQPAPESIVLSGATIWTCAKDAKVIDSGQVALVNGKIASIAPITKDAVVPGAGARVIDLRGKYITPGIIDCHSHTGISKGVNESGQAVTAEVRIGDVTDPDAMSWYWQLAGGVTTVNSLHGSANAIGGQNQVNKNRWGALRPSDLHFEGAIPGIKFALGENVKQSNWGDRFTHRYPQSRMGVETLIRDRFTAAREYLAGIKAGTARRDLELEALGEILEGKRLVHCHSYRQDEILMLCEVATDFNFTIGTFQHGLECYKVADEVKKHSRGASIFSDWWAYKVEVVDAIPAGGPIMTERGVPVSFNSDSDELARRLNVEAGKATKYSNGKITPSEAFKFVTLNPAIQLAIDDRVGSIEIGKDADLVVWSGPPTSSMSRAEMVFIDGKLMFSLDRDQELRAANAKERQRLVQKALAAEKRPGGGSPGAGSGKALAAADISSSTDTSVPVARRSLLEESLRAARESRAAFYMDMLRSGRDPLLHRSGNCGCDAWGN